MTLKRLARLGAVGGALVALGEAGHVLLDRFGTAFGHHLFHVLFAGGAAILFGVFALVDIRRNGLPRFSWSLRPQAGARE
ncbi:MAG TPA: hypothetical protein VJN50_06665 [Actinomycetota bacterium]|nr:hypothetical protein [Actinomycetota bacterium]